MPVSPSFQSEFDAALTTPSYRADGDRWKVYVNEDVLSIFGADDALDAPEIVERFATRMRGKFPKSLYPRSKWHISTTVARHWAGAGNVLHWAIQYGLVTQEAAADGSLAWRLVRREPTYIIDERRGWQVRQVRGLEPRMQAAQDKAEATRRRLNETLDRKARNAADDEIRRLVQSLVRLDPDYRVEAQSLKAKTPEICHGMPLAECASIVMDAHQRLVMGRSALKAWTRHLDHLIFMAQCKGMGVGRRMDPVTPIPAEIPAEDEDALAGLL
jgi:hypothetical protein